MQITYTDVLRNYAERAHDLDPFLVETALMSRSTSLRDVLAFVATQNTYTSEQLKIALDQGTTLEDVINPDWFAAFGRVVALQNIHSDDLHVGLRCLQHANRLRPYKKHTTRERLLEVAVLFELGSYDEAQALVDSNVMLQQKLYKYLDTDLHNPFVLGSFDTYEHWLHGFNQPFLAHGLGQLALDGNDDKLPFDRLVAQPASMLVFAEPKVSVIMTSYKPEPNAFLLAAQSILRQTWQNLELIIVDDATPGEVPEVLTRIQQMDDRVTVVEQPVNTGTYQARNAGVAAASGDYITGQDSDDWSHPDRIFRQVQYLSDHPHMTGVQTNAIRTNEQLVQMDRDRSPRRRCEISYMLPTHVARSIGGYLPVRKAADTEFRWRVEQHRGPTGLLREPLYITRLAAGSLSRGDFGPGWAHPVRRAFRNAFTFWHTHSQADELVLENDLGSSAHSPVPTPNKLRITAEQPQHYDVVFAGDWRDYGATQRSMLDEIRALSQAGKTVGVLHMESIMTSIADFWHLDDHVQQLINDGTIGQVLPDDKSVIDILVFHDPTILQFLPTVGIDLAVTKVLVVPELPPARYDGEEAFYHPSMCDTHTRAVFDAPVTWAAIDPAIQEALVAYQDDIVLSKQAVVPTFDPHRWKNHRTKLDGAMPVVGRHSERIKALWPATSTQTKQVWPGNGAVDIRILGDKQSKVMKYGRTESAPRWVVFDDGIIQPEAFMRSLDFFVYFPDQQWPQQYCRQALEAQAAGCLVILPPQFRNVHGDGPLYAQSEEVSSLIQQLTKDPKLFNQHLSPVPLHIDAFSQIAADAMTCTTMIIDVLDHRTQKATS